MVPELSKPIRRATFALLALAAVAVEIAARDGHALLQSVSLAAAWVAVAAVVGRLVPLPLDRRKQPPVWVLLPLLALAAAPFAVEPLRRNWTGDGHPLEIQMVCGLRNVGLGLAACAGWLLCLRLACVVSLFLMLFAAAMTNHPVVKAVLGLYAATGGVWLMLVYWAGLQSVFVTSQKAVAVEVHQGRERLPWIGLALFALLLGGALALALIGPQRAAFALGEWIGTSGGTGDTDPFARHGIGDGPEETAGDNARAAGMVETDKMIEDTKDALIDAVNDMYGPPHKPPKERQRMVAAGKTEVIQNHDKLPDNRRPSRDFDTSRQGPKNAKKPLSQLARGLFEVQGRTPLHVRLVAYDDYDATQQRWLEASRPAAKLIEPLGGDWMKPGRYPVHPDWYASDERHRLKAANMQSNLVPTPALVSRWRINKVNKPDYYDWDYEGVLVLAGRKRTPPGIVVTTDCRTLDPSRLPVSAFGTPSEVAEAIHPDIARLAQQWAGDLPHGWLQIEAVLSRLRAEYALDPDAAAPPGHPDPVVWFLTESQRGPDYLFATAATLLLRSLGYPTRLCLGYYAAPDAYDPETAHTPVKASDLHFWPEVRLVDGQWLVIEPTPGYDVLVPNLPLAERLLSALGAVAAWAGRHAAALVVLLAGVVVGWARRRELIDALAVRLWAWFPGRTWRDRVHGAVAILERRGRWAGQARSRRQTILTWLRSARDADLDRLTRMAEWAAYAPQAPEPWTEAEILAVCRCALSGWTLKRWHKAMQISPLGA